jgi:hypothetical protein
MSISVPRHPTQLFRIVAQDPAIRVRGRILTANVEVPAEILAPGPWGYRVQVVDYDVSKDILYRPLEYKPTRGSFRDPFAKASDDRLLGDPQFHAQNAYAITMRVLARFEYALGRRVGWSFDGHQIKLAPHAFADANAFYSKQDEALLFGYFNGQNNRTIISSLSHDVVAHETTHALVDGLRPRFTDPSSPDQAAFHEGFSDVVALLSVFAVPDVVKALLDLKWNEENTSTPLSRNARVKEKWLTADALRESALLGLAEEMGQELSEIRGRALRQSALFLRPSPKYYKSDPEFAESHKRGEILVASVMNAFVGIWATRLEELRRDQQWTVDRDRVAEEGASAADRLLTICIRALDYCPPVHLLFGDFLSAMLTADSEMSPNDRVYRFRQHLRNSFISYGIQPASLETEPEVGLWAPPRLNRKRATLSFSRSHFESLQRDEDEVFKFLWENRKFLGLVEGVFTRVESVRPCIRVGPDGFILRETVAEYVQILTLQASELRSFKGIQRPEGMPTDTEVRLYGGGVIIFDEFGQVKFHIRNGLDNGELQSRRLRDLFDFGYFNKGKSFQQRFSRIHRMRAMNTPFNREEGWT